MDGADPTDPAGVRSPPPTVPHAKAPRGRRGRQGPRLVEQTGPEDLRLGEGRGGWAPTGDGGGWTEHTGPANIRLGKSGAGRRSTGDGGGAAGARGEGQSK